MITEAMVEDSGNYTCEAKNEAGVVKTAVSVEIGNYSINIMRIYLKNTAENLNAMSNGIPEAIKENDTAVKESPKPVEDKMNSVFFKQHLTSLDLMDSDPMELVCKIEGFNPETMKAKWTQNKTAVPANFEPSHNGNELKLSLEECFPEDGGLYMCEVLDENGKCLALTACTVVVSSNSNLVF